MEDAAAASKKNVAFLGPRASYTHQAALDAFPEDQYDLLPQLTIEDVFSAVQDGFAARGVVPFENSTNGAVVMTLDLFGDCHRIYADIVVTAEVYVDVHHCLIANTYKPQLIHTISATSNDSPLSSGRATPTALHPHPAIPRTAPNRSLRHIRKIYSHPQAWGQCKTFLNAYLKGVERQDVSSTSRAAELASMDPTGTTAALSSEIAAQVYHLDMLAKGIEDSEDNTTRFLVLKKRDGEEDGVDGMANGAEATLDPSKHKTLVSFTVPNSDPGALASALGVFKPYNLNLTSINARPSGQAPWNYMFFAEIQGKRYKGRSGQMNKALEDLEAVVKSWRWLGSWENKLMQKSLLPVREEPSVQLR